MMVIYKNYEIKDTQGLIAMMEEIRPPVAGIRGLSVYRALCQDALKDERLTIALAEVDGVISGYIIVVSDWNKFWYAFLMRHLFLTAKIVGHKLLKRFKAKKSLLHLNGQIETDIDQYLTTSIADRSWSDHSLEIVKTVHIGIKTSARGKNLGRNLHKHLFSILAAKGIKRWDGLIDLHNISSAKMAHSVGFQFEKRGSMFFVSRDIS